MKIFFFHKRKWNTICAFLQYHLILKTSLREKENIEYIDLLAFRISVYCSVFIAFLSVPIAGTLKTKKYPECAFCGFFHLCKMETSYCNHYFHSFELPEDNRNTLITFPLCSWKVFSTSEIPFIWGSKSSSQLWLIKPQKSCPWM